eukprot:SAG31_NODE_3843_length_3823_cov_17.361171_2_plen_80_part_00
MQEAISEWWGLPMGTAGSFYGDKPWDPTGKPPSAVDDGTLQRIAGNTANRGDSKVEAPIVPWYTSRWMSNPSCRGYPWY